MQARFIATVEPHPEPRAFRARRGIPPGEAALVIYALVLDKQSSPCLTWRLSRGDLRGESMKTITRFAALACAVMSKLIKMDVIVHVQNALAIVIRVGT